MNKKKAYLFMPRTVEFNISQERKTRNKRVIAIKANDNYI